MVRTATVVLEIVNSTPITISYNCHYTPEFLELFSSYFWHFYYVEGLNLLSLMLIALNPFEVCYTTLQILS